MTDVFLGKVGIAESVLALEFDTLKEASEFCDIVKDHYKEERKMLYVAIDRPKEERSVEDDKKEFGYLLKAQDNY